MSANAMKWLWSAAVVAMLVLGAGCGSITAGGDTRQLPWNTLWPTPPEPAYWGTWQSGEGRWLQIEGSGAGYVYREEPGDTRWVRTPLRVAKPVWGSGWDLVTEPGPRYRVRSLGEDVLAVSGPNIDQQFRRAPLPEEVAAAVSFRQLKTEGAPTYTTDEESDWWWPF